MTPEQLIQREAVLREFGGYALDMAWEIVNLRAQVEKIQHDLDAAVGYKLATDADVPRKGWDNE